MNGISTSNVAFMIVQKSPAEDYYNFFYIHSQCQPRGHELKSKKKYTNTPS